MKLHLTRLAGEHLVAAELCRRDILATTFAGNLPGYDILAVSRSGKAVPVQVKTILGGAWQVGKAEKFLRIVFRGSHQQVTGRIKLDDPGMVYVFVKLARRGTDQFYVCRARDVQEMLYQGYRRYLRRVDGRRPKNPQSTHAAIKTAPLRASRTTGN